MPKRGMKFRYIGTDAPALVHTVTEASSEGIATWSEPLESDQITDAGVAGYSWFGPLADFQKLFQALPPLNPQTI